MPVCGNFDCGETGGETPGVPSGKPVDWAVSAVAVFSPRKLSHGRGAESPGRDPAAGLAVADSFPTAGDWAKPVWVRSSAAITIADCTSCCTNRIDRWRMTMSRMTDQTTPT